MTEPATQQPPDNQIHHAAPIRRRNRWLWFVLASGPIVYSLYFLIGYLLAEASCVAGTLRYRLLGLEAISFWIILLTVVAAAITAYSTVVALRHWQQAEHGATATTAEHGYPPFMAFVGAWLNGLFTLFILLSGVPAYFLVLCDWI